MLRLARMRARACARVHVTRLARMRAALCALRAWKCVRVFVRVTHALARVLASIARAGVCGRVRACVHERARAHVRTRVRVLSYATS